MGAADIVTAAADVVEAAVFHADVADVAVVVQADDEYAQFAFLAGDVFQVDVAHDGIVAALATFAVFVLQVDAQHGFAALADGDVAHEDVFNHPAAAGAGLDADDAIQIRAVHAAVLDVEVAVAAGDFAAYHHASVAVLHQAVAHDDVFAGDVPAASVLIAAGLDGDAVVARVEGAVFDEHILARLGVAAVAIGTAVVDVDAFHRQTFAEQGMDDPEGRVEQRDVFDEHPAASVEVDELRAQAVVGRHDAPVDGGRRLAVHQQAVAAAVALGRHAFLPAVLGCAAHGPPRVHRPLAVDDALAGDGDVRLAVGVDEGMGVVAVDAFPACQDGGEVEALVGGEAQNGTLGHVQADVALQRQRAGVERVGGDDHRAAAFQAARRDGTVDGFVARGIGRAGTSAEVGDEVASVGEGGTFDLFLDFGAGFEGFVEVDRSGGRKGGAEQQAGAE